MCSLDTEPCAVWNETPRIARKEHMCDGCVAIIRMGEAYNRVFSAQGGRGRAESECFGCWWVATAFGYAHQIRPMPSNLYEDLRECLEHSEPRHVGNGRYARLMPDAWASELAALKRRWRMSPSGRHSLRERWMKRALARERRLTLKVVKGRTKPLTQHGAMT